MFTYNTQTFVFLNCSR